MNNITKTKALWIRVVYFALWNGMIFTAFSVLWVKEYDMPYSDEINHIVVPWGWLACFFLVSFFTLRGRMLRSVLISVAVAIAFVGVLFLFIHFVLVPMYEPLYPTITN